MYNKLLSPVICLILWSGICNIADAQSTVQPLPLSHKDSSELHRYIDSAFGLALYSHRRERYLDSALALVPSYAYLWQQKSHPYVKQRKYELTIQYLDSAVKYKPQAYLDYRAYTECINVKDYRKAIKEFDDARLLNGNSGVMDHSYDFYTGLCYLQLGNFDSADLYLDKSIAAKTKSMGDDWVHPTEWFYKGMVKYEQENYTDALQYLDKCLHIDPHFFDAKYYKVRCLIDLKRNKEALELLTEAGADFNRSYRFTDDESFYEPFPYQILQYKVYTNMLGWLQDHIKKG